MFTFLIKHILWLKFSADKRQVEAMAGGIGGEPCKDRRVLLHFRCMTILSWGTLLQGTDGAAPTAPHLPE